MTTFDLKPDAGEFKQVIRDLCQEDWLRDDNRRAWPQYLFHFTDVRNAAQILNQGALLSRYDADQRGMTYVSSGSPKVLARTSVDVQRCVRFYFRPRTPTQYHCEGIRTRHEMMESDYPDAHCPVPVFLLFDAAAVLAQDGTQFSDGNLGSPQSRLHISAAAYRDMPWNDIYSQGTMRPTHMIQTLTRRRCAEVIVPHSLSLDTLRWVVCRSHAEFTTLRSLRTLTKAYRGRIDGTFFEKRRTFVADIDLRPDSMRFQFSPEAGRGGPFRIQLVVETGEDRVVLRDAELMVGGSSIIELPHAMDDYTVRLTLDDALAYQGTFSGRDQLVGPSR